MTDKNCVERGEKDDILSESPLPPKPRKLSPLEKTIKDRYGEADPS